MQTPFNPHYGSNQSVSANGTSASATINAESQSVRVCNTGSSNVAHVRIGSGTVTASATDTPILPSSSIVLRKSTSDNKLAYYSASGTTLQFQTGEGGF